MTFDKNNFKEVGGPGNSELGGQVYSVFSITDLLSTMLASGYLNELSDTLHVRDFVFLSGTNGAEIAQVETNTGVVTLRSILSDQSETIDTNTAIDITKAIIYISTTGTRAYTLADGVDGQRLLITMLVDGGDGVITPTTLFTGATLTFADAGDSCILVFKDASGWVLTVNTGVVKGA